MAPEQVRGELVGPATDVWGIGATLYEAATAELPFNAGDDLDSGSGSEEESGTGSFTETDTDLDSYEQVLRRAEPVRTHRRVPAVFANAIDA